MGFFKTACLVTAGLELQVREAVQDLVRKGEANDSAYARTVRKWQQRLETVQKELREEERALAQRLCSRASIPTRADIERLDKKLDNLAATVLASRSEQRPS